MSYQQVDRCLDILKEHPDVTRYIVEFNGREGFMYTIETDSNKIELQQKMNKLLDDDTHSGASWGCMLRLIQGILNGTFPYEKFLEKLNEEKLQYSYY
jgi:hypothetical protein